MDKISYSNENEMNKMMNAFQRGKFMHFARSYIKLLPLLQDLLVSRYI